MKRTTIKDGFGGELAFTKFIASDAETSRKLLNSLDLSEEDYTVTPEEPTTHSKRVDLMVRDRDGETLLVIESQDAAGWLDSVHASKLTYYMYDKKCDDGVLLCEDADEHIKGFVKWLNDNTPLRVTLISALTFEDKGKIFCEFIPLIRPTQTQDKKVVRRATPASEGDASKAAHVEKIFADNPGLFTNVTTNYVSKTNVGGRGITVAINPYKTEGYNLHLWHGGKYDNPVFRQSLTDFCAARGWEAKFQKARGYVNGPEVATLEGALNVFKTFVEALENKEIEVDSHN